MDEERKTSLEKMVATELLKLAMETDEERKARLKKMVATTQLRLAPETEDERRARLEYLSDNPIYTVKPPRSTALGTGCLVLVERLVPSRRFSL